MNARYLIGLGAILLLFMMGCEEQEQSGVILEDIVDIDKPVETPVVDEPTEPVDIDKKEDVQLEEPNETVEIKKPKISEDLEDSTKTGYPNVFFGDTIRIIVGNQAPARDVLSATSLQIYLINEIGTQDVKSILVTDFDTDDEVDVVLLGTPCDNDLLADALGLDDCNDYLDTGKDAIYFKKGDYTWMVITGKDNTQVTERAGRLS